MNQQQIGKFLSETRKKKNITQKELADKIGVTNKAISKWENGRGMPDYSLFQPLCEALDISVTELLNGKESKNDIGIVNYLEYKEKQYFKKIILFIVLVVLILICCVSGIYFVNSYKKINVYELKGQSENFYYEQGLIIKSNIKNVIQYGDLSSDTISDDKILSASLAVKIDDEYFSISNFQTNFLISEKYGYGEYFNDKTLSHIPDDLYIIIFYEQNGSVLYEELKVYNEQILSNDKLLNLKGEAEYSDDIEPLNLHQYDNIYKLRDKALENGFSYNNEYNFYLNISNCLTKKLSTNEYIGFDYKAYLDTFRYYIKKNDFTLILDNVYYDEKNKFLGFSIFEENKYGSIGYYFDSDEVKCSVVSSESDIVNCEDNIIKYKDYVIKAKDLFLEYYIS